MSSVLVACVDVDASSLDEAWTFLAVFAKVFKAPEDVSEPDVWDALPSPATTGGVTREGVDCAEDRVPAVELAMLAVSVEEGVAAVELSAKAEGEASWLWASMVEGWLAGVEETAPTSVVELIEVEDVEIGVGVWGFSEVVNTADSFVNRGARSRLQMG